MKEVNRALPKIDGLGLVLGKPVYTDDIAPKDALVVKILRSPHAFARIKSINTEAAKALKGVECVLTHKDVPKVRYTRAGQAYPETSPYDKYVLDEYVRYVGDDVAIVAATTEEIAEKALKLIKVEYEVLQPVLDMETAEGNEILVHPEDDIKCMNPGVGFDAKKNVVCRANYVFGDVEEALKGCDVVVNETYYTQSTHQTMMETFRTATYLDFTGRLVVISSTQIPFHVRRSLATALEIPQGKIRVIKPRIGGGYGAKQTANSEYYPAIVTLKTGKPAQIIYSRQETFESGSPRHPARIDVTIGATKDGRIKAIDMKSIIDSGATGEHCNSVIMAIALKSVNMYNKVDAARYNGVAVYTNTTPKGAFRGFGATQGIFALESAINELSHKLNMDPTVVHEMNMIRKGEKALRFDMNGTKNNGPYDIQESCGLDYCVAKGKELIGWDEKYPRKQVAPNKVRGVGMAIARQGSGVAFQDMGSATIKLNDDGSFILLVGATDLGTGSDTILSQICAEAIGVPTEKIHIVSSDTDLTPFDSGAYASSTTYVSGNAVKKAGENMRKLIFDEVAKFFNISEPVVDAGANCNWGEGECHFNLDETAIVFDGEKLSIRGTDKYITLADLGKKLMYAQKHLTASDSYVGHKSPTPYMAGFAEVEVDTETGKIYVVNFAGVLDVGTVVNPTLAKVQAEGGIVHGIGMALYEEDRRNDKGKLMTNNLMVYKVPTRYDIGNITVDFAESYEPTGPFGAKSIGEVVVNSSSPAIQEAIYNAVGVRVRTLPITPEKVLMGILDKE